MKRALTTLALIVTTALTGVHAEEEISCDLRVTRIRNADHMDCYLRLGPKSPSFSHTNQAQLDELSSCLDQIDRDYKLARYLCDHGRHDLSPMVQQQYDVPLVMKHYQF